MRKCYRCENWVSLESFGKDNTRKDGLHPYCKNCRSQENKRYIEENPVAREKRRVRSKKWKEENPERYKELISKWKIDNKEQKALLDKKSQLWSHYRLTIDDYLNIFDRQKGMCAICKNRKRLYVDHDHSCCAGSLTCGRCVRGLICQKCNMMMHYIDECPDLFESAFKYAKGRIIVKELYDV